MEILWFYSIYRYFCIRILFDQNSLYNQSLLNFFPFVFEDRKIFVLIDAINKKYHPTLTLYRIKVLLLIVMFITNSNNNKLSSHLASKLCKKKCVKMRMMSHQIWYIELSNVEEAVKMKIQRIVWHIWNRKNLRL